MSFVFRHNVLWVRALEQELYHFSLEFLFSTVFNNTGKLILAKAVAAVIFGLYQALPFDKFYYEF